MKFIVFSRRLIERYEPYDKPHIIISVRSPGDPEDAKFPVGDQTLASLRLQFHESYEEQTEQRRQHHIKNGNAFTVETGRLVLDFVERYADKIEAVILHCDAGLARSPAIAHALSETVFIGEDNEFFVADRKAETNDWGTLVATDFNYGYYPTCFKYIIEAFGNGGVGISAGEMSSGELELKLNIGQATGSVYLSKEMWLEFGKYAGW